MNFGFVDEVSEEEEGGKGCEGDGGGESGGRGIRAG